MNESNPTSHVQDSVIDRRRFLRRAAITAGSIPVIMTLTAPGAMAAACSASTNRDDGCDCTQNSQCMNPAQCRTVAGRSICCIMNNQTVRSGVCFTGADSSCCSGFCDLTTHKCKAA